MKSIINHIKIPACSKDTIARANNVFPDWIDSDFTNWGTDVKSPETEETELAVLEIDKNGTFENIFGSISKKTDSICLTQAQIIAFVKYNNNLLTDSYATFFLFKVNDKVFVAGVYFGGGSQLTVSVHRFSYDFVWRAVHRPRVVVPQLALENSDAAELRSSETLTLEAAIARVKQEGYVIYKTI